VNLICGFVNLNLDSNHVGKDKSFKRNNLQSTGRPISIYVFYSENATTLETTRKSNELNMYLLLRVWSVSW